MYKYRCLTPHQLLRVTSQRCSELFFYLNFNNMIPNASLGQPPTNRYIPLLHVFHTHVHCYLGNLTFINSIKTQLSIVPILHTYPAPAHYTPSQPINLTSVFLTLKRSPHTHHVFRIQGSLKSPSPAPPRKPIKGDTLDKGGVTCKGE